MDNEENNLAELVTQMINSKDVDSSSKQVPDGIVVMENGDWLNLNERGSRGIINKRF